MSANGNYLDELQDTKFKRIIINFIKRFKEFKEHTKNSSINLKRKNLKDKCKRCPIKQKQD